MGYKFDLFDSKVVLIDLFEIHFLTSKKKIVKKLIESLREDEKKKN